MSSASLKIQQLAMAVDSHSWEDFPSYHLGDDASQVLAGWTALWHPALIKAAGKIPSWLRTDVWPEQAEELLLVVPSFAVENLPDDMAAKLSDLGGHLVVSKPNREQLTAAIFQQYGIEPPAIAEKFTDELNREVTQDFHSLGYCYLQVQLMTRQLRHSSGLDDELLTSQVLTVFDAIDGGQADNYTTAMQACFDVLIEERSRYYPTMASFVDYVLLTPKTLGTGLRETLAQRNPLSLQASGETIEAILGDEQLVGSIQERLNKKTLTIAGGEFQELPNAALPTLLAAHQLKRGQATLNELAPTQDRPVYSRRTFGLRVGLPALLEQFGIDSVVHSTLDDGVFPQTSGHHIRWEGDDHTTVDGLVAPPLLASQAETWLSLAVRIGEMIDVNHYATMLLVHWPGKVSEFYSDVINSCRFGAVLGSFVTLESYFDEASDPGYSQNYSVDDYRSPWLKQMVAAGEVNAVSRFVDVWRDHVRLMQSSGWAAMRWVLSGSRDEECDSTVMLDSVVARFQDSKNVSETNSLPCNDGMQAVAEPDPGSFATIVNPFSFPRIVKVPFTVSDNPALLFSEQDEALVKIPAMGFANLKVGCDEPKSSGKPSPPLAEENVLQNEFFQLEINPTTGGIGAIRKHKSRTNMLSQQLALRERSQRQSRSGGSDVRYSTMKAGSIEIVRLSKIEAAIRSTGSLLMGERTVGSFQQTCSVQRGQPIAAIEIELDLSAKISGDPWQSYAACRFAWDDESAILSTWQNDSRHALTRPRMLAPTAIEIDQHKFKVSLLTAGLPFHQKIGDRQLDSLLVVSGEQHRLFRIAVGINLPYPDQAGLAFIAEALQANVEGPQNEGASHAWLFHVNCKNVMALNWQPVTDAEGRSGVKILLKETAGRAAELTIRCVRSLFAAKVSLLNDTHIRQLEVKEDRTTLSMSPLEMKQVELFW